MKSRLVLRLLVFGLAMLAVTASQTVTTFGILATEPLLAPALTPEPTHTPISVLIVLPEPAPHRFPLAAGGRQGL